MLTFHVRPIKGWDKAIQAHAQAAQDKIELVLEKVGEEVTRRLVALTETEQGWRNVTGNLEEGYTWHVDGIDGGARLILRNDVYYAVFLEARDGFMVLHGVLDPGGLVEQVLVEVAAEFAPEWTVVRAA